MALATAQTLTGPVALAVVCDGVSASDRPDEASLAAAQAAARVLLTAVRTGEDPAAASVAAVRSAIDAVAVLASQSGAFPSATYISAVMTRTTVTLCWLGDSRGYWLGNAPGPDARQLTRDDSLAEEMVAAGLLTQSDADASPHAHVLTRWVGADTDASKPHVAAFEPPGPGAVLLCSDGLWNYQPDAAKLAELALPAALTDPLGAAGTLVNFALDAGGMDNVTVVLAPFPPTRPARSSSVPAGPQAWPLGAVPALTPCPDGRQQQLSPKHRRRLPMSDPGFTIDICQNEYLPDGGRDVHAVITVTSSGSALVSAGAFPVPTSPVTDPGPALATSPAPDCAQIIIIDCSGSMNMPQTKMKAVLGATAAAVNMVHDGVSFAVIAGTERALPLFPDDGTMAIAGPRTKVAAKRAVIGLRPGGGTAIGQWLHLARYIFTSHPAELRHAILLTDGKNEHETPGQLDAAIGLCRGVFTCDCRGIGTDWEVAELRRIATALLGTVDIVSDPKGLQSDLAAAMQTAMGKQVADVALRIWTPQHASIRFVHKVAPFAEDLTGRRAESGPQTGDYPIGAWGAGECREYHLCVRVTPGTVGQVMLAARVRLAIGSPAGRYVPGEGLVKAVWTADEELFTAINPQVAQYCGQTELAQVIQEGLAARKQGDSSTTITKLGRAVALAEQSGNEDTARLLARVVDVVDAPTGTVRLKKKVEEADEMTLDTRSTRTVRTRK
jgi:serine/threonine protein phosphatase PrpC